jgi:hypothetical protein
MATMITTSRSATRKRAWLFLALGGAAAIGLGSFATPALADDPAGDSTVVVCRSGVVTEGDVSRSALTETKAPAASLPETPGEDCRVR